MKTGIKVRRLLFATMFVGSTLSVSAQQVTLSFSDSKLEKVLSEIKQQTGYSLIFSNQVLDTEKIVSINVTNVDLEKALEKLLAGTDVQTEVKQGKIYFIRKKNVPEYSNLEKKKITGIVKDEKGEVVIGANVIVKGTSNGTITDIDGKFALDVPAYSKILISYIGLAPQELSVTDKNRDFTIILKEDSKMLDGVVVTALGIKREEKALGYAVQQVQTEELKKVQGVDVATSLTGKIAGMSVLNSTDFGEAPTISLRGETPLLVIDGVPYSNMSLRDIAAEDIESIDVLKGASASALYGYRGASGAIMVTTKKGSSEEGDISVSITSNTMLQAGFLAIPEKQSLYGRGTNYQYVATEDNSWGVPMDGRILNQWDPILKEYREYEYLPVGKDNFKNFLEQGYVTNNTLSIGYQTKIASLRTSFNWTENKGQYPNSKYDKYGVTFGGNVNLKKFKLDANMAYHKQASPNIGFNGYTSYDPMYTLLIWSAADYDIRDYKNNYWLIPDEKQNFTYKATHNNPYYDRYERTKEINRDIFNASIGMTYEFTPWLKAIFRSGLDFYVSREDIRVSQDSFVSTGNTGAGNGATWIGKDTGAYATGRDTGYSINTDFMLNAEKTLGEWGLEGMIGGNIFFKQDDSMWGNTVNGISVPGYFSLKASVDPANVGSTIYRQQVNSIYGRFALSWRNLIYTDFTLRNDWSSTLPKSTRSYLYPSVSGSFVASELLPESTKSWLDMWKLRGSWTVSKTPPGIYSTNINFTVTNPAWGTASSANMPTSLSEAAVNPESSSTYEVGSQAIFLKKRLIVDVTYFNKLMYDFLVKGDISPASGFTSSYVNSDEEIVRRGWELALTGIPVRTKNLEWSISANWSKYARYYNQLDEQYSSDKPWVKVGNRVDAYALKDYALDPEGNHIFNNGRIQFNPFDSCVGYSDPDWIWGLSTQLSYKNWSLSVSFDGRVGGLANTMTESYMWNSGAHPESLTPERAADVANPGSKNFLGQGVKVVSGKVEYDAYGNVLSDTRVFAPNDIYTTYKQYVTDMHSGIAWGGSGRPADLYSTTFFKLRELSLTYNLPENAVKGWAKSASVSLVGQNLFLWAKDFKYSDPDGGSENFSDPSIRYMGFNIKLTF